MKVHQPYLVQVWDLLLIQLTNWRWSWRSSIIIGILAPTFLIATFSAFSINDVRSAGYILTGNLVLSLLLDGLGRVSSNFAYMRLAGTLDYFATLPIHRSSLIIATVLAFLLLSLPSALTTLLLGWLILRLPLAIDPLVLLVIPLISLSLSGLGAFIGLLGRNPEEVNSISTLTSFVLFGFGPVLIPLERLPEFMNILSLFSPATYAASALRHVLLGQADRLPLLLDLLALIGFMLLFLWLVIRRLDWRTR